MTGLADHFDSKSGSPQSRLQRRLITDDQDVGQCMTQGGQGVERHRPGEAPP
jgi:hypothetical protein